MPNPIVKNKKRARVLITKEDFFNAFKNNKNARDKAVIKAQELHRVFSGGKNKKRVGDYYIEIIDAEYAGGNGITILARVWDDKNNQIGFGRDGSIDIERFRIFNPPIAIDSPTGDIKSKHVDIDGNVVVRTLKIDPEKALLESIAHTIRVKKQKNIGGNIIPNSIGNTTSTFYPDADPESTSMDAYTASADGGSASWSTLIARDGDQSGDSNASLPVARINMSTSSNQFDGVYRSHFLFDTSAISDTATIDSATLSLYGKNKSGTSPTITVNIFSTNPASNTAIADGDHDTVGSTEYSTKITYASWNTSDYNDFVLNATGESAISKTGVSKFSTRDNDHDAADSAPSWSSGAIWAIEAWHADETGTSKDPKLVVEHTDSTDVTVNPSVQSATFSLPAESVQTGLSVSPAAQVATFSIPSYTVSLPKTINPSAQSATFSIPVYTVTTDGNITVSPAAQVATFGIPAYSVLFGTTVSPSAQVVTVSIPTYAVGIGATITPTTQELTFTIPAYSVLLGIVLTPSAQAATFSIPTYSVLTQTLVSPTVQVLTFTTQAPTLTFGSTIQPSVQVLTFSIPTLAGFGAVWAKTPRATNSTWARTSRNSD